MRRFVALFRLPKFTRQLCSCASANANDGASPSPPVGNRTKGCPKKRKTRIPKALCAAIWNKYIGEEIGKTKCPVCMDRFITQMNFHCGHIVAESKGGQTNIDNLMPICATCNMSMGTMNLIEFRDRYFVSKQKPQLN